MKNIGFVSTWFERGAAYVTKSYIDLLKDSNNVYVYARGGEEQAKGDPNWDYDYVTWGLRLGGTKIAKNHISKWIEGNNIDILFFNEQHEWEIIAFIRHKFPNVKMGSYIDYYKNNTVEYFDMYDFLICNTKRHYSVFKNHIQCFYVPWGTDIDLYKPRRSKKETNNIKFFHSVGMSKRKGTDILIKSYIDGKLYRNSELIIHTQLDFSKNFGYEVEYLRKFNINVIEKTVPAPGLYYLGDVYVYPTTLEGLGLTIDEAIACGLPVITTNHQPMNERVNSKTGKLVEVDRLISREDGYYWPLSIVKEKSLIETMQFYINNKSEIEKYKTNARHYACEYLNWKDRKEEVENIFINSKILKHDDIYISLKKKNIKLRSKNLLKAISDYLPAKLHHYKNEISKILK